MKAIRWAVALIPALAFPPGPVLAESRPDPDAQRIIQQFGLREASRPIRDEPDWKPRRVVVSLPEMFAGRLPGLEQRLLEIAGDVELHIDRSPGFTPDAGVWVIRCATIHWPL